MAGTTSTTEKAARRSKKQIAQDDLTAAKEKLTKAEARLERANEEVATAKRAITAAQQEVDYKASHWALKEPEPLPVEEAPDDAEVPSTI